MLISLLTILISSVSLCQDSPEIKHTHDTSQYCEWNSDRPPKGRASKSVHTHSKQESDMLNAMAAMEKSSEKMIKSLIKAMVGKNETKKIIEDRDLDEWVLGHHDNSKLVLEMDDKAKSALNSKHSLPIGSETSANKKIITNLQKSWHDPSTFES